VQADADGAGEPAAGERKEAIRVGGHNSRRAEGETGAFVLYERCVSSAVRFAFRAPVCSGVDVGDVQAGELKIGGAIEIEVVIAEVATPCTKLETIPDKPCKIRVVRHFSSRCAPLARPTLLCNTHTRCSTSVARG
jgi:hypothetical protein